MTGDLAHPDIVAATERIRVRMGRSAQDIIDIGRDLDMVKRRLGYGNFDPWLKTEFEMTRRMAEHFINVFNRLGSKREIISRLKPTVLYELAAPSTPPEVRDEAIEMAKKGKAVTTKTVTDLKAKLRKLNAERQKSAEFNRQLSTDLRHVQIERDAAQSAIARLRDEVERVRATGGDADFVGKIVTLFRAIWSISNDAARDQIRSIVTAQSLRVISGKSE